MQPFGKSRFRIMAAGVLLLGVMSGCAWGRSYIAVKRPADNMLVVEYTKNHVSFVSRSRYTIELKGPGPTYTADQLVITSERGDIEGQRGSVVFDGDEVIMRLSLKVTYSNSHFQAPFNGRHRLSK